METMVKLFDTAPEIEAENGFIYLVYDGRRIFASQPHVARIAIERVRRILDELDAANAEKVVAFR